MKTIEDVATFVMDKMHDVAGAYFARRKLAQHEAGEKTFTGPLYASVREKALNDEQLEKLALDTWEKAATAIVAIKREAITDAIQPSKNIFVEDNTGRREVWGVAFEFQGVTLRTKYNLGKYTATTLGEKLLALAPTATVSVNYAAE